MVLTVGLEFTKLALPGNLLEMQILEPTQTAWIRNPESDIQLSRLTGLPDYPDASYGSGTIVQGNYFLWVCSLQL